MVRSHSTRRRAMEPPSHVAGANRRALRTRGPTNNFGRHGEAPPHEFQPSGWIAKPPRLSHTRTG
jgi:hypothetical protein